MAELFGLLGTKLKPSTAYHPQTDGQTERANRTIVQMLRTTLEDDTEWDEHLALVEHAYNSTVQASTGYTPFYLIYGRDVPSPITRLAEAITQGATNPVVQQRLESWRRIHRKVVKKLTKAQVRMKRSLVAPRRPGKPVRYRIGDQVMLRITDYERSDLPKLRKQWAGPFDVLQVIGPAAVKLNLTGAFKRLHPVIHVSKVKPYVHDYRGREAPQPVAVEVQGGEAMEIERIVARELVNVNRPALGYRYLVKWRGYPEFENTWLPAVDFLDDRARRMRNAFDRRAEALAAEGVAEGVRGRRGRL